MTVRSAIPISALFLSSIAIACGGDDEPPRPDATAGDGGELDGGGQDDGSVSPDGRVEPDAGMPCTAAAECDDGLFCNGAEQCAAGSCEPGDAPALDDGVDCTVDTCDEALDEVVNTPDDGACNDMNRTYCDATGRAMQDTGVCDDATGCGITTTLLDACDTAPMCDLAGATGLEHETYACVEAGGTATCELTELTCDAPGPACATGVLSTSTPTCDDTDGCDVDTTSADCAVADSSCETGAGPHLTYAPSCADATSCDATGTLSSEDCGSVTTTCAAAVERRSTPTCDVVSGCGAAVANTACTATADSCQINRLTREQEFVAYTPACAPPSTPGGNSVMCLAGGIRSTTTCNPPASACVGRTFTTYNATCDPSAGCGSAVRVQDDCSRLDSDVCRGSWTRTRGTCSTATGCGSSSDVIDCAAGGSICISPTISLVCPAGGVCAGGTCRNCRMVLCLRGCRVGVGVCL